MNNIIATAFRGEGRQLLKELKKHGSFSLTNFRDVLIGEVININEFLEKINDNPPLSLARIIPLDDCIEFTKTEELIKVLEKRIVNYEPEGTFRVTVERRGWKGLVNSSEWERRLGSLIDGEVNLKDPDFEIIIELMDTTCGITMISREQKSKYYFIKSNA